jgi:hypothetical protein
MSLVLLDSSGLTGGDSLPTRESKQIARNGDFLLKLIELCAGLSSTR